MGQSAPETTDSRPSDSSRVDAEGPESVGESSRQRNVMNPEPVVSPQVSVCIPSYNGEEYIAEAIESILRQSLHDLELIVADDGSTDRTLDVVTSIADPRIRVHCDGSRRGIPGNWNRCLDLARGTYVCVFHQDDIMHPDNLYRKVQILEADLSVTMVHSAIEIVMTDGLTPLSNWVEGACDDVVADGDAYFRKLLFRGNLVCAPSVVAPRRTWMDVGGFDEQLGYACDYEMWMKMCVGGRVAFLREPLIRYRWHKDNASYRFRSHQRAAECALAARLGLRYYVGHTGKDREGQVMEEALSAIDELRRSVAAREERIAAVESERDRAWQESQQLSRSWEEQKAYIQRLESGRRR